MTNIIGSLYKVISFGESHGKVIGCVIDGCPSGIYFNKVFIQNDLNRRRPGSSNFVTPRNELDKLLVLSGVFNNITTGSPIGIIVRNKDFYSKDYSNLGLLFRPGHADLTYETKYGLRDFNGGGRSSARITIALVIAGSLARYIINDFFGITVFSFLYSVGKIKIPILKLINNNSKYFIPNSLMIFTIEKYLKLIIKKNNSIGAIIGCIISNIFCGLGEPLFKKINSNLSNNLMSLNAVKAIDFGMGINCFKLKGIINNDFIYDKGFLSNNSGGVLGGISTGQELCLRIYIKPTASIALKQLTINKYNKNNLIVVKGRHDPCVGIRAVPIIDSIISITILDLIFNYRIIKFF